MEIDYQKLIDIGMDAEGIVDMAAAIRLAGDRLCVQTEAAQDLKQRFVHPIAPFLFFYFTILF